MSIILQTPSNGSITLSEQNTASNITVTIPATTGTLLTTATAGVPVNGPAFSAYQSTAQSISNATTTKLEFQTEEFDTNNNFAANRFTPTVAGYYQINGYYITPALDAGVMTCVIYKNGAAYKFGNQIRCLSMVGGTTVSSVVYLNGTTDYVEIYAYQSSGGTYSSYVSGFIASYFNGALVRSAT